MRPPLLIAAATMMACAPEIVTPLLVSDGEIVPPRDRGPPLDETVPPPVTGGDAGVEAGPDAADPDAAAPDAADTAPAPDAADAGDTGPDVGDAARDVTRDISQ
ncbi:MAG: hypothetical protein R3F65_16170 [bacterium]